MRGFWRFREFIRRRQERALLRNAERAVAQFPSVNSRRRHGLESSLVVSLTSYPPRFPYLARTLRSLLDQTIAADRTVLWIAAEDMAALPSDVRTLREHGLEIRSCRNLLSFKKLVPALGEWPQAAIVTADDDAYYSSTWLEELVEAAVRNPGAVIGHRVHRIAGWDGGALPPYESWEFATTCADPECLDETLFPTGVGGVLYPPASLDSRVSDADTFMRLCPRADDIWFFWMARLAGTAHRGTGHGTPVIAWTGSQDEALYLSNWLSGDNDRQLRAMEQHFGHVPRIGHAASEFAPA